MQLAILEYAQNVVGMVGDLEAKLIKPVEISTLAEHELAGSQRKKGRQFSLCFKGTKAFQAYGQKKLLKDIVIIMNLIVPSGSIWKKGFSV